CGGRHAHWAVLMWGSLWWAARNQFSKQSVAHGPRTMRLDVRGFTGETKDQFLLYSSPRVLQYRPETRIDTRSNGRAPKSCCGKSPAWHGVSSRQENRSTDLGFLAGNDNSGCAPRDG